MLFKDKVCIVTGSAVGLGRAFCEQLLKQGAFVSSKHFCSEVREFINRLHFYRLLSLTLTRMPASFAVWSYNNSSAKIA